MPSLATLSAGLVINSIPFNYVVGTDAHNEDKLTVGWITIYQLDNREFHVVDNRYVDTEFRNFDEFEDVIKYIKEDIEE
jgi:hypothetical protein